MFLMLIINYVATHECVLFSGVTRVKGQPGQPGQPARATDQQHQCHIECFINLRAGQPGQSKGQPEHCPQLPRCSYATGFILFYVFSELQNVLFFLQLYYYFCDNCFNLF